MGFQARVTTGPALRCKGWRQEGLLRMLENTLACGERPEDLIIYAATGKAARDWSCFVAIVRSLKELDDDETLVIQSGKPVAVFRLGSRAPRVLMANCNLVGKWATWPVFRELDRKGLIMYGQYTAGCWAYIGVQGILQGTYETLFRCAERYFGGTLQGRLVLTAGLGGMGSAQPLAVKMNGGVALVVEVDPAKVRKRVAEGRCDMGTADIDAALGTARRALAKGEPLAIAVTGNASEIYPAILERGAVRVDVVTDQTSAHDPLNGYVPGGMSYEDALRMRQEDPEGYVERSLDSMARQVEAMLALQANGAVTFEYGNNIRAHAKERGIAAAFDIPGFVPLFVRPDFCRGRGPFRWVLLSGDREDLVRADEALMAEFPEDRALVNWLRQARSVVPVQGLPSRVCWLGMGARARAGEVLNELVRRGELGAPVAITRDHLDSGAVAQPTRETEGMRDGSDAVADWPLLNALLTASGGADLVAIHQGAGSGMGGSISAGNTVIADGSDDARERVLKVLTVDPGIGVVRHAEAEYEEAVDTATRYGLRRPMGLPGG